MNQIQILGILSLVLAVIASVLCAARLGNWRHPVLLIGMISLGLLPGSCAEKSRPIPTEQPTASSDVGSLVQSYYERIKHEQAARRTLPSGTDAAYSRLDRSGSPRL
jgi:hypothetical protein